MKDYVKIAKGLRRETIVPLGQPPGHAQVDFREAIGIIGGVRQKLHVFFMDLPHSDAPFTTIVKLALLTRLRRTEIAAVCKAELDLSSASPVLTIPRGRAKNRNAHRVPLSPQAATLFRQALDAAGDSEFVFPSQRVGSHIAPRSVSKAMERTREKLGIKDITMHDLRRTAGTYMSRLGVPKDVRERILNHGGSRKGSVTDGVYNHYEYDAEKRASLELWADAIDGIQRLRVRRDRRVSCPAVAPEGGRQDQGGLSKNSARQAHATSLQTPVTDETAGLPLRVPEADQLGTQPLLR